MYPFKANPLVLFCVIALLGIAVMVLIAPDVDRPDTTFQTNHTLDMTRHHQAPRAIAYTNSFLFSSLIANSSIGASQVDELFGRSTNDLTIKHESLRC